MRRNRHANGFSALTVTGGLLSPEFLQTIAALGAKRQSGADYGLTKSLVLKDELARYWRIANDLYAAYAERRVRADIDPSAVGTGQWLLPLLKDVFGYPDLVPAQPVTLGERHFPITHQAFDGAVPLVLTTSDIDLDRADPRFGDEGRRRAPHGLLQELLNADPGSLWAIASNGTTLRLLRENPSLTRPAYLQVDLERIFQEQLYADFAALWLTLHASRLHPAAGKPSGCILEAWRGQAQETGERALEHLREGVTEALRALGNGFLQHPANEQLRERLAGGKLSAEDYFQELLRLVYRLLFLFTAEERQLLRDPQATDDQRAVYREGYAIARLRERALRRRHYDRHADLWESLRILFRALALGAPPLGLPALGGLFASDHCPTLDGALISNERLLEAIRALAFFRSGTTLARVNYRDMGTEELGSVYESLLELHPHLDVDGTPWTFGFVGENGEKAKGSTRKLTGSYYTPAPLVNELIKSALEPVMAEAVAKHPKDPRRALLDLRIVDPACGSGHFLLAAARRVAAEIARIEAGSDTPDEAARQHALREVVQHGIYGVDRNPLAVELCKTALWIETVEPGKPLTFLDPHVQCGDSLIGILDPAIMANGIPDEAYQPLTGDEKKACQNLKRRNRLSDKGVQGNLFDQESLKGVAVAAIALDAMPEETLDEIAAKQRAWEAARQDAKRQREELRANLFVGAFFGSKTAATLDQVPLTEDLNRLLREMTMRPGVETFVGKLAEDHRFFHWHVAFAEIMQSGGFDVVLGNPPWEVSELDEVEYFVAQAPQIASLAGVQRKSAIAALASDNPRLWTLYQTDLRTIEASNAFARSSQRFELTARGKLNLYALFAETFLTLISARGRAGLIVPSGIATDSTTSVFFGALVDNDLLRALISFENEAFIFPAIHHAFRFCLLTLGAANASQPRFSFFLRYPEQMADQRRQFTLTPADLALLNPTTKTAPIFRSNVDAELTKKIYARVPVLVDESKGRDGNPWGIEFKQGLFNMTSDSGLFRTFRQIEDDGARREGMNWIDTSGEAWVPLYEAKMIHHYDHRWATYEEDGTSSRDVTLSEKQDARYEVLPRYWVTGREVKQRLDSTAWRYPWLTGWRDITGVEKIRTAINSVFPLTGVGHTLPLLFSKEDPELVLCLVGNLSSMILDYIARQKVGGTHLTYFYLTQFAVLRPNDFNAADVAFIVPRILELSYTSHAMGPFAKSLGFDGPPFPWDSAKRARLRAELDAYYARLYGLTRDELRFILDPADVYGRDYPSETFRVLQNDEIKTVGEYRSRRLILDAWDRIERTDVTGSALPLVASDGTAAAKALSAPARIGPAALADGAWARPQTDQGAEVGVFLTALLKVMEGPLPIRAVRTAAVLALEPRLLIPFLTAEEAGTWSRLIGREADSIPRGVTPLITRGDQAWGATVRNLRGNGQLIENLHTGTWERGSGLDRFVTSGWPDGRAGMVLDVLKRLSTDEVVATLPDDLRRWVDAAAA